MGIAVARDLDVECADIGKEPFVLDLPRHEFSQQDIVVYSTIWRGFQA